jgi:hypothetical protein
MTARDTAEMTVAPAPTFLGQGTAIEQSRAIAEVQAAVIMAKQFPRDLTRAVAAMREAAAQPSLAERAFYRFPRGGETVTGSSIHLARELARCWGNIQYGLTELRRDDEGAYSEMQAVAWDLEANTRAAAIFVVPHKRDTKSGIVVLPDLRSVYESNANQGARRVREQIWAVLPGWYIREAEDRCRATLEDGGGKSIAQRVADAVAAFEGIGVTVGKLEARTGKAAGAWTAYDLAQLQITFRAIRNSETTIAQEFPDERVTVADIIPPAKTGAVTVPSNAPGAVDVPLPGDWTDDQRQTFLIDMDQAADAGDFTALQALEEQATAAEQHDLAREVATAIRVLTDGREGN